MHQSIIRDGNHFIKLTGRYRWEDSWLLISGPAFDHLESFNLSQVRLLNYVTDVNHSGLISECPFDYDIQDRYTYWERKIIEYRGYGKRQLQIATMDQSLNLAHRILKYTYAHFNPIDFILLKKDFIIAWICEDGILPAHITNVNWDENLKNLLELKYHRRIDDARTFI